MMLLCTSTLIALAIYTRNWPALPWFVCVYTVGTLLSYQCQVLGHEGTPGLVFKTPLFSKIHSVVAFLPVFLGPFGMWWMVEHMWHHNVVVDKCLRYGRQDAMPLRKAIFTLLFINIANVAIALVATILFAVCLVTILLYSVGLRTYAFPQSFPLPPYTKFPQTIHVGFMLNTMAAMAFNFTIYHFYGLMPIAFMFCAGGFMNGLHPLGMRQVQEHYFIKPKQPTYSNYTTVHNFALNINYHVEHHDFPTIPWSRLPQLRKIAPEFYNNIHYYTSYTSILWLFLFDNGIPIETVFEDSPVEGICFSGNFGTVFDSKNKKN